ncbi:ABC transporter substrate-binding protein [Salidesulfovibrio onnuriiensis]|uniref:ABC transporter substrate-binding protein n=1 Tax=Salidesulfovibrio onnuriiensis TaxID=2583823 RepID=UPI0011C9E664|nr:helical backbone metal receptor [Salidesulfovibrio onnuriiensis]
MVLRALRALALAALLLAAALPCRAGQKRYVSLAPSITETAYALGMGRLLAGTPEFSNHPPEALELPRVGSYFNPNLEKILALKPDGCLALKDSTPPATLERLRALGIDVFLFRGQTMEELARSFRELGEFMGAPEQGRRASARFLERIDAVRARTEGRPRPRVLCMVQSSPMIIAGKNTFIGHAIRAAGGEPVAPGSTQWTHISLEQAAGLRPDIILALDHGRMPKKNLKTALPRNTRIFRVDPDLLGRPSPKLADAVVFLANLFHPY